MLISEGQLATLIPDVYSDAVPAMSNQNYYPNTGISLDRRFASYAAIYSSQLWVATLVNKLAFGAARLPLKVYTRDSDNGRTEQRDSPYAQLLRSPNPKHDPFFFWLWTASTFELYGEAMWAKSRPRAGAAPTQLWPMHPSNVFTRRAGVKDKYPAGTLLYALHAGNANTPLVEFPEWDVVHFRSYNPSNQVRGLSRLEPLRATLLNEDAARRANQSFWANGARPSVILQHPKELSEPAMRRLKGSWDSVHAGVDSWSKTAILEEGMTANVVALNAEELQYIESRRMNREEVCAVFDVPPPVVHILDKATFSNITEQMKSMYRDTMAPRLTLFESVLDAQLRPDFDPAGDLYAEFLMDQVMRGAFEERAVAIQAGINSGQVTPNEARALDNRPALPGGDKLYINGALIPLSDSAEAPADGTDVVVHPQAVKCVTCGRESKGLSKRNMCRSCEGTAGGMKESA